MSKKSLKQKLYSGEVVFGPFLKISDPAVVEIAGHAGFDFVIIDTEHGPNSVETVQNLIRAAEITNIAPIVRVAENNPIHILKIMDIGAHGIQVPQISKKSEAENVVSAALYHPLGERGVCRYVRAANYSSTDKHKYFSQANENALVIVHLEGLTGLDNLSEILEVGGLDVVFLGPYDLSQSCGVPGEINHPKVKKVMTDAVQKAKSKGKIVGTFVENIEAARSWIDCGVQYISYSVDVGIFFESCKSIVDDLKRNSNGPAA